jgi:hypothetical protein
MIGELEWIAEQCDGVRRDMRVLPEVLERTWGIRAERRGLDAPPERARPL